MMKNMKEYVINLFWDDEASVWVATNDIIPLTLESGSLDLLIERVRMAAPELLEVNGQVGEMTMLRFQAERLMQAIS